jgi:hypothetical protein
MVPRVDIVGIERSPRSEVLDRVSGEHPGSRCPTRH